MVSMEAHRYTTINLLEEGNLVLDWELENSACPEKLPL